MIATTDRIQIERVSSQADLRTVDQLRQEIFVLEMGYCQASMERERGVLSLAHAQGALFLATYDGFPAGAVAVDWWRGLDVGHRDVQHLQMKAFADAFGSQSLLTARKWLVKPEYRGTRVALLLIRAVATMTARHEDVHFVIIDCSPEMVHAYSMLGFRRFGRAFRYTADQACSIPMCFVASDLGYLRCARSPVYGHFVKHGQKDRPDVAAFFTSLIGESANNAGEIQAGIDELSHR